MSTLLLKNLNTLITCDDADQILHNVDVYCEDGWIRAMGEHLPQTADTVIDGTHYWCYPGLVNTHHHLYQTFSRNLPQVQNMELFDWLTTLYEIWKNLDSEVIRLSSLTGMGELLKHGCTTCFDHHYVFPAGAGDLLGTQFAAAEELGIRMFASRGSMDLSRKDGGLPPDSVVQTVDEIMRDSVRVIEAYHDSRPGSMRQVALAPCSPFSVSPELLRQSAILARQYGVRLHTHLCETRDEERYMLTHHGVRPLEFMSSLGWTGPDVWFAHGIHFNDEELRELARTGTGVAHCPISNMKLASGVARVPEMLALGVPVGLAVDGSASNDGSSLMEELRVAYLLHRLHASKAAPSGYQVLKMATRGSARLLGRDDIGQLAAGKCADLFLVDSRRLELVGGEYSPADVLATVGLRGPVDCTVVQGRIVVRDGRLVTVDEAAVAEEARGCCRAYLEKKGPAALSGKRKRLPPDASCCLCKKKRTQCRALGAFFADKSGKTAHYPQTSSAISFTRDSFAHCCASVSLLPISQLAKPHWGLRHRRSRGIYLAASWMRAITAALSSSSGRLVVTRPSTTFFSPLTAARGSKPPERSSSNSR